MDKSKALFLFLCSLIVGILPFFHFTAKKASLKSTKSTVSKPQLKCINSSVKEGETLCAIFQKLRLDQQDLQVMREEAAKYHRLRDLRPGNAYSITLGENRCVESLSYQINDNTFLKIEKCSDGFAAQKLELPYETRTLALSGRIKNSLIGAFGDGQENLSLAMQVSDILAYDIDFNTDLRDGDTFKIIVDGLYLNGEFKKFGQVKALEIINDGNEIAAYHFEQQGKEDYYDRNGNSLRKAFLKAPLSFRRISSNFSRSRLHPILKVRRPHEGIDYVGPAGTPVSAAAEGRVVFAGKKGGYGNLIILSHRNNLSTYYGHLSRFARKIRAGARVAQGQVIGYVGMTGLATGPHLHYEMRQAGTPVNPARFKMIAAEPIPRRQMSSFKEVVARFDDTFKTASFQSAKSVKRLERSVAVDAQAEAESLLN